MQISPAVLLAWTIAAEEAASNDWKLIEPEHILIGILSLEKLDRSLCRQMGLQGQTVDMAISEMDSVNEWTYALGINATKFRRLLRNLLGKGEYRWQKTDKRAIVHRSMQTKAIFQYAEKIANIQEANSLGLFNLISAIAEAPSPIFLEALEKADQALAKWIETSRNTNSSKTEGNSSKDDNLYGRNLTELAKNGLLGPFLGRTLEIGKLIESLIRLSKNNVIILGEAGVGKTALVEQLALSIAQGNVPHAIKEKQIYEIQMGSLISGSKYRGDFEERIRQIVQHSQADPNIILFIDEIHTLLGAGNAEGALDAANILKPALARGSIRCIGATTTDEYYKTIAKDPALDRRFSKLLLPEPTESEAVEILIKLKGKYESAYGIEILPLTLEKLVQLSQRFDINNRLPDKVIDLLEQSCVRMFMKQYENLADSKKGLSQLDIAIVCEVLSEKTKIQVDAIRSFSNLCMPERLIQMEKSLTSVIIGQNHVVEKVVQRLLLAHSAIGDRARPLAVFLFAGPSGTGKTEMTKQIQHFLFGQTDSMIRLDMSEFAAEYTVSRLIGAPPGYIGHDEEGQLTKALRRQPYSVVLLDEIEKAHPRIFDIFLQLFSEGRLTDGAGRTISAKNSIFVMTSNLLSQNKADRAIGFQNQESNNPVVPAMNRAELQSHFRLEFLNRIDDILLFLPFSSTDRKRIVEKMLCEAQSNILAQYAVNVVFETEMTDWTERVSASDEGARGIKRTIESNIESEIIQRIIRREWVAGETHSCVIEDGAPCYK